MLSLKKRWGFFLSIVFDPWFLLLFFFIGVLFYLSVTGVGALVSAVLFALITVTSAIIGGRLTKQWMDVTETSVLAARGTSAVRSLKLLFQIVASIERRLKKFLSELDKVQDTNPVTKRNYEELLESCNCLQEQTVSSIENWTDIVPEADIKSIVGMITDLKSEIASKQVELESLGTALNETKDSSEKDRGRLRADIIEKASQIKKLESELRTRSMEAGIFGTPALTIDSLRHGSIASVIPLTSRIAFPSMSDLALSQEEALGGIPQTQNPNPLRKKVKEEVDSD